MKVSLYLAQKFSNYDIDTSDIQALTHRIGTQLGEVEEVVDLGKRYEGVVVAEVKQCDKHPNADKLSLCMIDDGGVVKDVERDNDGLVQVVCGAPNVKKGMKVAWLPPGSVVPSTFDGDPFTLEARELRGKVSNGMLASAKELSFSDEHEGILEITEDSQVGDALADVYGLNDTIIDIENKMFTHRPDCFGLLGVVRELAGISGQQFSSPDWYLGEKLDAEGPEEVDIQVETELVPRFTAIKLDDVKVAASPVWLQTALSRVGMKSINNIVDITNYVMYVTGQPLHAYDTAKLHDNNLTARLSKKGEKIALLNGKTVEMKDDETIVIASGETAVGIGGVMGGANSEVSEKTTSIILECASFDMYSIRRTSMKYGLFTDAVTRFNKGQSVMQNGIAIAYAVSLLQDISGAQIASKYVDVNNSDASLSSVNVSVDFINTRLGSSLSADEISTLLKNVEFTVTSQHSELRITAPFWRTDIEIPEDIVEEVGRLYGYHNLPQILPARPSAPASRNVNLDNKAVVRNMLASYGANEMLTYSFIHGDVIEKAGQATEDAYELNNAMSPDLQYYRMSIIPSLLDKVHKNSKLGHDEFTVFEVSKVHSKQLELVDNLPQEVELLAAVYANRSSKDIAAFYSLKHTLVAMAEKLGVTLTFAPLTDNEKPFYAIDYQEGRSAAIYVGDARIGVIGEVTPAVRSGFKLPQATAGFEIDFQQFASYISTSHYKALSQFPIVSQDISLKVPADTTYEQICNLLSGELLGGKDYTATLTPLDIYQREDDTEHVQYAFRFEIAHYNKTLKSQEVNAMLDAAAHVAAEQLNATRL